MGAGPIILAIEASQRAGGVALRDAAGREAVQPLGHERAADAHLMPAIDALFRDLSLQPADLQAVAVSIGPGGFTGLRIAVSVAKMLALATGARCLAVPSALVAAASTGVPDPLAVALACKRNSMWLTRCARAASAPQRTADAPTTPAGAADSTVAEHFPSHGYESWRIVGDAGVVAADAFNLSGLAAVLADRYFPDAARRACVAADVPVHEPHFDPRACLALGMERYCAGVFTDAATLEPLYARQPEAVSLWESRRAAGNASGQGSDTASSPSHKG